MNAHTQLHFERESTKQYQLVMFCYAMDTPLLVDGLTIESGLTSMVEKQLSDQEHMYDMVSPVQPAWKMLSSVVTSRSGGGTAMECMYSIRLLNTIPT